MVLTLLFQFFILTQLDIKPCDTIPPLNQKILEFAKVNMKKKVGRGECWDLAAGALNSNNAKWDGRYKYGAPVEYKNECLYPGDIVQFERVVIETRDANGYFRQEMPHHTAVIYEVHDKNSITIAHQNYNGVRKVVLTDLKFSNVKSGKLMVYRPVK